jgi:hypothetical protein
MDRQKRGTCRSCRNSPARRVRPPSLAGQLRVSNVRRRVRSSSGCSTGKARSSNKPSLDQVGSSADREEGRILGRDHSQQRSRIRRIFGSSSRSGGKARSSIHVGLGRGGGSVVFEPVRVRSKATSSTHLGPGRSGAPVSEPASICSPGDSPQTLRARVVPRHGGFGDRRRRPGDGLAQPSLTGESALPGDFYERPRPATRTMLLSISLKVALTQREGASESPSQKRSPGNARRLHQRQFRARFLSVQRSGRPRVTRPPRS